MALRRICDQIKNPGAREALELVLERVPMVLYDPVMREAAQVALGASRIRDASARREIVLRARALVDAQGAGAVLREAPVRAAFRLLAVDAVVFARYDLDTLEAQAFLLAARAQIEATDCHGRLRDLAEALAKFKTVHQGVPTGSAVEVHRALAADGLAWVPAACPGGVPYAGAPMPERGWYEFRCLRHGTAAAPLTPPAPYSDSEAARLVESNAVVWTVSASGRLPRPAAGGK